MNMRDWKFLSFLLGGDSRNPIRKPEPRPKQPSARRLALAARARLCGLSLTEERGVWALTRPIDEGRVAVNYFPSLKDVETALETAEQVDGHNP